MLKAFLRLQSLHYRFATARTTGLLKPIYIVTSIRFALALWRFSISRREANASIVPLSSVRWQAGLAHRTEIATCARIQRGYNRGHTFVQLTISKEHFK